MSISRSPSMKAIKIVYYQNAQFCPSLKDIASKTHSFGIYVPCYFIMKYLVIRLTDIYLFRSNKSTGCHSIVTHVTLDII